LSGGREAEPAGWSEPEPAGWSEPEPAAWSESEPAGWSRLLWLAGLTGLLLLLVLLALAAVAEMPFSDWSGARLASSASLLYGYRLYYGAEEGPALATLYGPVSMLLYLPSLLSRSVTGAVLLAGSVNVACMLLPLLVLHRRGLQAGGWSRIAALIGFAVAGVAVFAASPTQSMSGDIHVDAPAVGLGLLSCALLQGGPPSWIRLAASALLAVLAVWTKQIEVLLLPALLTYGALRFDRRSLRRQLVCLAAIGAGVSLVFVAVFGFDDMRFNMFSIPYGHLLRFGAGGTWASAYQLALECLPFVLGIALAMALERGSGRVRWLERDWLQRDWLLPVLAALFLFPISALARTKLGAWENSYHALYYLIAGSSLALASVLRSTGLAGRTLVAVAAAATAAWAFVPSGSLAGLSRLGSLANNPQEQAFRFTRAHSGQAYFPWHPLATAYAEGKLYHFDYAVLDRDFAGYRLSPAHVRAFVPEDLRYVIFHRERQDEAMLRYLPQMPASTTLPDMPDWVVYVLGDPG
jgi:hypothetical protein